MNHLPTPYLAISTLFLSLSFTHSLLAQDAVYVGAPEPRTAPAVYGQGVRESSWLSAEQEQAGFHLPPGFKAELFASEPQIAKPLNMAWDTRGRMWVSSTVEYPYPVADPATSGDTIKILEDTDGDGRADRTTTFADRLNIPMGLLPVADGVICFSIPNIWYLRDTDGDDRVDERIKLLGPFDTTRDTHGMINALRRGDDGWIYACHGFNNQSQVTAADGSQVQLFSGNTFRFREDGSRIEQFTQGQVNPFGMTRDQWGNWYTADCHSKPLTALVHGACYPSFGRPHDGLGFAPEMMEHLHGSTAISGVALYQAQHFPAAYRNRFYSGNVMTSRINCNAIDWNGTTARARELPDFLTSDDPWFRPVDIQVGPDGALYVADFYNKIIGHYEVPLEHPGRDRKSGRIWRIIYVGEQEHEPAQPLGRWSDNLATSEQVLLERLSSKNLTTRRLAIEAALHTDRPSSDELSRLLAQTGLSAELRLSALEICHRRGQLPSTARQSLTHAAEERLRAATLRLASELPREEQEPLLSAARQSLTDPHPQVVKSAIGLLARAGGASDVRPLLSISTQAQADDPALAHAARIAVRKLLRDDRALAELAGGWGPQSKEPVGHTAIAINDPLAGTLAGILPALDSAAAANALLGFVADNADAETALVEAALEAASKVATGEMLDHLLRTISRLTSDDIVTRSQRFDQLCTSYLSRNRKLPPKLARFGAQLQSQLLSNLSDRLGSNTAAVDWLDNGGESWAVQQRHCQDGQPARVLSSLTRGERYTGVLRSESIRCPAELRFWLAGHNGRPADDDRRKNFARLVHAITGETIATAYPPRNDVAAEIVWQLEQHENEWVRVEVVDGDSAGAYAWLALGRFSLGALNHSGEDKLIEALVTTLRRGFWRSLEQGESLLELAGKMDALGLSQRRRARLIVAALEGAAMEPARTLASQALALDRPELVTTGLLVGDDQRPETQVLQVAQELCATATALQQRSLAKSLLGSADGCRLLAALLAEGRLNLQALRGAEVLLPTSLDAEVRQYLQQQLDAAGMLQEEKNLASERSGRLDWQAADRQLGQQLYKQHCSICHQLGGEGQLVGPQLDGAIARGASRLCEDILDPNRNVDLAFRLSTLLLDDDTVVSGLVREETDGDLLVTGADGKTKSYRSDQVVQRRNTTQSLMPANFGELLNDQQLASLLKFLTLSAASRR